jgi:hypothetical protein
MKAHALAFSVFLFTLTLIFSGPLFGNDRQDDDNDDNDDHDDANGDYESYEDEATVTFVSSGGEMTYSKETGRLLLWIDSGADAIEKNPAHRHEPLVQH